MSQAKTESPLHSSKQGGGQQSAASCLSHGATSGDSLIHVGADRRRSPQCYTLHVSRRQQRKRVALQTRKRGRAPPQNRSFRFVEHWLPSSLLRPSIAGHRSKICRESTVRTQEHVATGSPCSCSGVWGRQCSCMCAEMSDVQADRYPTGQANVDACMRTLQISEAPAVPVNSMEIPEPVRKSKGWQTLRCLDRVAS